MPDLTGFTALDVAIGLAFFYFLLSIVSSAINELIASLFKWRANNLETGIRRMLGEAGASTVYSDARIKQLERKDGKKPSYIPSRAFALTVMDTFAPDVAEKVRKADPTQAPSKDLIKEIRTSVDGVANPYVKRVLKDGLTDVEKGVASLRGAIERDFDESMDRVSGWYKRKTQIALLVIAVVVTLALNADSFVIGSRLSQDEALRTTVVAKAIAATEAEGTESEGTTSTESEEDAIEATTEELDDVSKAVADVKALKLPLGWEQPNVPADWDFKGGLAKFLGLLITALAVSLGAPFWFDVLNRFANLRGAGTREPTAADKDKAASTVPA